MAMFRFIQWINEGKPVKLNGDGTQSRGFTYLDDISRGVIAGLKPLGYEIINLGGHETINMNDLIARLESVIGKKAQIEQLPANKADMQANWANVEKATRLLGWQPQVNLEEGLQLTVEWYLKERAWASQIVS
jgi:nucleoside-diphosphate-sugar epimerase